jgi:hypothetical protein
MRLSKTLKKKLAKRMSLTRKTRYRRGGVYSYDDQEKAVIKLSDLKGRILYSLGKAKELKNILKKPALKRTAKAYLAEFNSEYKKHYENMPEEDDNDPNERFRRSYMEGLKKEVEKAMKK